LLYVCFVNRAPGPQIQKLGIYAPACVSSLMKNKRKGCTCILKIASFINDTPRLDVPSGSSALTVFTCSSFLTWTRNTLCLQIKQRPRDLSIITYIKLFFSHFDTGWVLNIFFFQMILYYFKIGSIISQYINSQNIQKSKLGSQ